MFTKILVPLDGSPLGERALPIAASIAQSVNASLLLVRAVWTRTISPGLDNGESYHRAAQEAEAYLEAVARRLGAGVQVQVVTPHAPAPLGILQVAEQDKADLIVMTTHGRSGLSRWVYGSVAEAVLSRSPIPVLLVRTNGITASSHRSEGADRPRLLVPLDGSTFAAAAIPPAADLARAFDWTVTLLRVVTPSTPVVVDPELQRPLLSETLLQQAKVDAEQYLASVADGLRREGLRVQLCLRVGEAAEAILDECSASGASLVVMATHGRTGLGRLLYGSVAGEVLHRGTLPLLLVRPEGLRIPAGPEPALAAD
ncbi:MAG: universal stress protein [Anaerolineae bacterium]|nr:universal stress protein [Anaerolineae bacterium]